jgi:uncharacterized protein YceH (UPF0502 family)
LTLEEDIISLVEENGPRTGTEVREALGPDGFGLWKTCTQSSRLEVKRVGRRYLRLDKQVAGYARLSPSILREFLTYSVVGLASDPGSLDLRAGQLAARIREISAAKLRLAQRVVAEVVSRLARDTVGVEELFCVLLAGDIVYEMGHDAPRPERSTGTMVRGSDIDLVIIMDDKAPEELARQIDDAVYEQKYRYLINPSLREEFDYVIKPLARLRGQAEFDTFKNMVPCKILDEAVWLYGSQTLFQAAKAVLKERGISERLAAMEEEAARLRERAEQDLLSMGASGLNGDVRHLFYPTEESDEFD